MKTQRGSNRSTRGRTRDPEATRERLLECAFEEIYEKGYAGASLDQILAESGVTKGALYHHFESKADLTVAMIAEVLRPRMLGTWVDPIRGADDPIDALITASSETMHKAGAQLMKFGCPLNNLAQELSNLDERFRHEINVVFDAWRGGLAEAFAHGQQVGTVRADADPEAIATFIVAGLEGMATTMKSSRDVALAESAMRVLFQLLESLRPPAANAAA